MRRPAVRFLLTLAVAASMFGVAPAKSEAGIIPWAWDTVFGPVGSIHARRAYRLGYGSGGCCGPAVPYGYGASYGGWGAFGSGGCCNSGCNSCGAAGYSSCSSCGTGFDAYGVSSCGAGGCANGQCNVNYPPNNTATGNTSAGGSPVTPAPVPNPGGPTPGYDNRTGPMVPNGGNENFVPPVAPGPGPGAATTDGFKPSAAGRSPAPTGGDPTKDENYIPPRVTPPGAAEGTDPSANGVPAVEPRPAVTPPKRPALGDDDEEKGTSIGPRFELNEKVTWQPVIQRTRMAQSAVRVSAHANRLGLFAKTAWRSNLETELAKK